MPIAPGRTRKAVGRSLVWRHHPPGADKGKAGSMVHVATRRNDPPPQLHACPPRSRSGCLDGMHVSFNLAADLDTALKAAAKAAGLADADSFAPEVRTADPRHGDFQANGVLAYAKARKLNPRAVAEQLIATLPASLRETYEFSIAGPGFINFALKPAALNAWLRSYDSPDDLRAGAAAAHSGQTWVVD